MSTHSVASINGILQNIFLAYLVDDVTIQSKGAIAVFQRSH